MNCGVLGTLLGWLFAHRHFITPVGIIHTLSFFSSNISFLLFSTLRPQIIHSILKIENIHSFSRTSNCEDKDELPVEKLSTPIKNGKYNSTITVLVQWS